MPTSAAKARANCRGDRLAWRASVSTDRSAAGMVGDPPLHLAERLPVSQLPGELGAELGLVAGPAQEHHQVPGDVQGRVPAEVVFHQGQREVDPGGDARRGGDVPVPDEDRILPRR